MLIDEQLHRLSRSHPRNVKLFAQIRIRWERITRSGHGYEFSNVGCNVEVAGLIRFHAVPLLIVDAA
jgi:hypothetical protein